MRILYAKAKNFLSYQDLDYKYDNQGLTLIEGHDEDLGISTGTGKSAFLDVVSYGLFSVVSKDLKADECVNRKAKGNMEVVVGFEDNGKTIEIHRYRKHSKYGNDAYLVEDGNVIRGKDLRETEKLIESRVGFNYDTFVSSTYFSQFSPVDKFLSASDTEKKLLISQICGFQKYDEILEKVKIELRSVGNARSELDKESYSLKEQINVFTHNLKTANERETLFESIKQEELTVLKLNAEGFETQRQLQNNTYNNNIDNYRQQIIDIMNQYKDFKIVEQDFSSERNMIGGKLKTVQLLESKSYEIQAQINSLQREMMAIQQKINSESSKIQKGLGSDCYHCYQPISSEHINKHIIILHNDQAKIQAQINALTANKAEIDKSIAIKASLNKRLEEIRVEEISLINAKNMMRANETKIASLEDLIKKNEQMLKLNQEMSNSYLVKFEEKSKQVSPYKSLIDSAEKDLARLKPQYDEVLKDIASNEEDNQIGIFWKDAFQVYIRSYLMDSFIDQLNIKANDYLKSLFDGVLQIHISATTEGKESKEKISVVITNGADECSYQSLSGGERCRICLAINLAVSDINSMMSSKNFNILMMDEVFNGLDEHGKNQTMKLLKSLEPKFDTIFVIDHTEAFKSMFTNVVSIKKRAGVSQVVETVV